MPYPMLKWLSWDEVIAHFNEQGVSFRKTEREMLTSDGDSEPISYFENEDGGRCVVYFDDATDPVMPTVLRSICSAVNVDPAHFGLNLG